MSLSRVGVSVVDVATGATAHAAILEALIRRGITGRAPTSAFRCST